VRHGNSAGQYRVRAAPRATDDSGAVLHRCVAVGGWGACRQAGQGVAGIGEAGVEACGVATAVKFKLREWQELLMSVCYRTVARQAAGLCGHYAHTLRAYSTSAGSHSFAVRCVLNTHFVPYQRELTFHCKLSRLGKTCLGNDAISTSLGAARNIRVTPTLATHPPIAPARATAAFHARHPAQLPLKLRCGIQTTRSRPASVLRVMSTSRLHSPRIQPSRPPAPQLLSVHATQRT
jgi:hypothetical protein